MIITNKPAEKFISPSVSERAIPTWRWEEGQHRAYRWRRNAVLIAYILCMFTFELMGKAKTTIFQHYYGSHPIE